jgi:hypothetical protein
MKDVLSPALGRVAAEDNQFRMVRMVVQQRMHFEFTEAAGQCDVLRGRDGLVAEEQHFELQQRGAQRGIGIVVERTGKVHTVNLCADHRRAATDR